MTRRTILVGLFLSFSLFLVHFAIIDDYGITWDFHHHFFAGLHLINHPITPDLTDNMPFTEPDPRNTYLLPFGPLMSVAPVLTYKLFYEDLKLLAFDNAYNLSIIISGVGGILILYLFLLEATNFPTALLGFLFLAFLPRYFGDLHNNMKDVPQAAVFALAIWMFWRLVKYRRIKDLLLAAVAFAIAFNTKVNTLAVPMIAAAWTISINLSKYVRENKIFESRLLWQALFRHPRPDRGSSYYALDSRVRGNDRISSGSKKFSFTRTNLLFQKKVQHKRLVVLAYFFFAPLLAFFLWALFWQHPIQQLLYIPQFFRDNTQNIEVLLFGKWYCSARNTPWYYPLEYLAITTPLATLTFFLIGLISLIRQMRQKPLASLLILWFFVPIARYAIPTMGVIDGIRHFEEVVFPLAAIAAIGAATIFQWLWRMLRIGPAVLVLILIFVLVYPIIQYHPFQISYFNELVGGIKGAYGKFDIDYWGGPQKLAMIWLNEHAPTGSKISVVMAADAAAKYLRPDLRANLNHYGSDDSDYVVVLNRQSFFYRYFYIVEYFLRRKTAYVVENQGVPIVWIYDNHLGQFERTKEWWHGDSPCILKYWATPAP